MNIKPTFPYMHAFDPAYKGIIAEEMASAPKSNLVKPTPTAAAQIVLPGSSTGRHIGMIPLSRMQRIGKRAPKSATKAANDGAASTVGKVAA